MSEGFLKIRPLEKKKAKELKSAVANNYWSSIESSVTNAWRVNFNNGNVNTNTKSENTRRARCFLGQLILTRPAINYVRGATFKTFFIMKKSEHLPLYLKLYQLTKLLYETTRYFSKQYKYTLGEEILNLSWRCVDLVIKSNTLSKKERHAKVADLSVAFDCLKARLRMAQEIGLLSERQYAHIQTEYIKEAGEMIGGWFNWSGKE